jgi:hypothetical protein
MAFFKRKEKAPAEVQRLDWKLLERGAVALYHKSNVLSSDLAWFRQQNYAIHELNATTWATPADFHADAQRALLSFPDHYRKNLASWIDCLAEMPVPDEWNAHLSALRRVCPRAEPACADDSRQHRDDVAAISIDRPATDRPVQSDDPRIRFERVGAMPVTWNPQEWLDADRGVGRAQ